MVSTSAASLISSTAIGRTTAKTLGETPSPAQHDLKRVRDRIHQAFEQGESTGIAVAVVNNGHIVWEEGFGWSDRERGFKITRHSAFNLESVTKPFTTTLLTTLAAEGRLDLDKPANRYLGPSKINGTTNGNPEIVTVRLLGAHASGLPSTYEALYDGVRSPPSALFLKDYGRLAYPPGRIWEYSNAGFAALGDIAWNLTRTSFDVLMASRVLNPLGLRNSFWDTDSARMPEGVPRLNASGKKLPFHLTTTPPSGELLASAHDLAIFAMWNMKLGLSNGGRLLNDRWINELHKPVFVGHGEASTTFGWALDRLSSGETVIHKEGGGAGASTIACMVPARKLACIVLNNHQTSELTKGICDQILLSYLPSWKMPSENREPPRTKFVRSETTAGSWKGTLTNDGITAPIALDVVSDNVAMLTVGLIPSQQLNDLCLEGDALVGSAAGLINAPDVLSTGARTLQVKLIPHERKLVGRIIASQDSPDNASALPFVVSLSRSSEA